MDDCNPALRRSLAPALQPPRRPGLLRISLRLGLTLIAGWLGPASSHANATPNSGPSGPVVTHEVIALAGQPAPGGLPGETFGPLLNARPRINGRGDIAFVAPVLGIRPDGTAVDVVFLETPRGLFRLAQGDSAAPGSSSPVLGRLTHLSLDEAGNVAFLTEDPFGAEAILSNGSGLWKVVINTAAAHPDGIWFQGIGSRLQLQQPRQHIRLRAGQLPDLLFPAASGGTTNVGNGLWSADADGWGPRPLFVQDQPAPEIRPTYVLAELPESRLGSYPGQRNVFLGTLRRLQDDPFPTNNHVVWTSIGRGLLTVAAQAGQPAPYPTPNVFYGSLSQPSVSADGTLAFAADLVHAQQSIGRAAFAGLPGSLRAVVRDGDPIRRADGSDAGSFRLLEFLALNARGQLLVQGFIGDNSALARWSPNTGLTLLVEGSTPWPGAPRGWSFGRRGFWAWNANASGRAALSAELVVEGVGDQLSGLWITDAADQPVLVAIAGPLETLRNLTPPPGVLAFDGAIDVGTVDEFAGGSDGLPRFFGDGHEVVYTGTRADGATGIFVGRIEPASSTPRDESLLLGDSPEPVFRSLENSDPAAGTIAHPTLLFPDAGLQARSDKDWTGGRLVLEITENLAANSDLLGLDARGLERQRIGPAPDISEVQYLGLPLGSLARPRPGLLEITFRSQASTDGVRALIRSLAFGSSRGLAAVLRGNARHLEPPRRLRLRLSDAGGRAREATRTIVFPRATGITFEGYGPEHLLWDSATRPPTQFNLAVQLVLTDTTRLSLGCAPEAAAIEWFPSPQASFRLHQSDGSACASADLILDGAGGFPSIVRLHGWEARHVLRRDTTPTWVANNGGDGRLFCVLQLVAHWLNISANDTGNSGAALAAPDGQESLPTLDSLMPSDLLATPYALRDWMRRTTEGQRLASLYDQHSPEVGSLLLTDLTRLTDTLTLIREFLPGVRQFLAGNGAQAVIRPDMIDQLNRVWDRLANAGSPTLRQAMERERARFHDFQDFSGRSFAEWGARLGWDAPRSPFVTASSPRLLPAGFQLEANRIPGLAYSLRRTDSLADGLWSTVTNAALLPLEHRVELIDPAPPTGALFYRVEASATPATGLASPSSAERARRD